MLKMSLFVVTIAALAFAGVAAHADEITITGEPVDISCFLSGKAGEAHAACAKSCAEKGQPIGIAAKSADGKEVVLYLALGGGGKAAKDLLAASMGKQVKVTGAVADKGGMKIITVTKVEAAAAAWQPAAAGSASVQNSAPATQKKPE